MAVPSYYRSRSGRVFRVTRVSETVQPDVERYTLSIYQLAGTADSRKTPFAEVSQDLSAASVLDKLRYKQAVPTPESLYERLWSQVQVELEKE